MQDLNPPAEIAQHQQSLFSDPVSRFFEADFNLKTVKAELRDMETDFPIEVEELIEALKELQLQVNDAKEVFQKSLMDNPDYQFLCGKRLSLSTARESALAEIKGLARVQAENKDLDLQVVGKDGFVYKLQTLRETDVFINGKLLK